MLRRTRLRRALRITAITLVAAWAFYLVGMNVLLRTGLLRHLLSEDPVSFLVDYSSAYSIIPGRVHVEDLRLRGRDSNVEWILTLDRCDFRFGLLDFAHRRFHAYHVRGDGLSMRVRQREPSFTAEEVAALPPVPGFSDPPYSGPPSPPISDADYHLWSVWLEDVDADHVREIWVDTMRYSGDLEVRGRWFFRPVRWLDVGPATIDARSLDVSYGLVEGWVSGATGHLTATVHPYDVRALSGADVLHQVSLTGDLRGAVHVATIAQHALRGEPVTVVQGETSFEADLAVDHGVLRPGMRVHVDRFSTRTAGLGFQLLASVEASADVDDVNVGQARLDVDDVTLSAGDTARATAGRVAATFRSHELDLADPFTDTSFAVDATDVRTRSLGPWRPYLPLPPDLTLDSGDVAVSGHVAGSLRARTFEGRLHAVAHALTAGSRLGRVEGDVSTDASVKAALRERRVDLSGSDVRLENVRVEAKGVRVVAPVVTVRAPRLIATRGGVLGRVGVEAADIDVPSLAPLASLLPLPSGVLLDRGHAHAQVHLAFDLGEGAVEGTVGVIVRDLSMRVGSQAVQGELAVALTAKQRGGQTDITGSSIHLHPSVKDGWWARLDLPKASMSLRGGFHLDAQILVHAQDASPITALLESHAAFAAKLAIGVVSTTDLRASGEIVVAPSAFEVRSVVARADGLGMSFEMAKLGQERIGAALLVAGPVRAGVDLHNDSTSVMLEGAEPWFVAKTAALRLRERAYE
jgi:hypothetical protein